MRAEIGDVVIDKTYRDDGEVAIVVGKGIYQPILIHHNSDVMMNKLGDYFSTWSGLEVIGHIDIEEIWKQAMDIAYEKERSKK